jgi:hypothetical protein
MKRYIYYPGQSVKQAGPAIKQLRACLARMRE